MPSVKIRIDGDSTGFESAASKVTRRASTMASDVSTLSSKLGRSFVVGAAASAITAAGRSSIQYGGHLADLASKAQITAEKLQEIGYAAELNGASIDDVSNAFRGLARAREAALSGNKEKLDAFGIVGLGEQSLRDMPIDKIFDTIASEFRAKDFGAETEPLAEALLGRGGAVMVPTLKSDMAAAAEEARRLGIILKDDVVANLDKMGDLATTIAGIFRGRFATAVSYVGNLIAGIAEDISTFKIIGTATGSIVEAITKIRSAEGIAGKGKAALDQARRMFIGGPLSGSATLAAINGKSALGQDSATPRPRTSGIVGTSTGQADALREAERILKLREELKKLNYDALSQEDKRIQKAKELDRVERQLAAMRRNEIAGIKIDEEDRLKLEIRRGEARKELDSLGSDGAQIPQADERAQVGLLIGRATEGLIMPSLQREQIYATREVKDAVIRVEEALRSRQNSSAVFDPYAV